MNRQYNGADSYIFRKYEVDYDEIIFFKIKFQNQDYMRLNIYVFILHLLPFIPQLHIICLQQILRQNTNGIVCYAKHIN